MTFPEHPPRAVKSFLNFVYTGEYRFRREEVDPDHTRPVDYLLYRPLEVYMLADFLIIPELQKMATKFIETFFSCIAMPGYGRRLFWERDMPAFIAKVYRSTNSGPVHAELRRIVVDGCRKCLRTGCSTKSMYGLSKVYPEFGDELLESMAKRLREG